MKAAPIIIALALLGAIPLQAHAQAVPEPAPAPEAPAPLVVSLSAQNSWMNSNNSQPITVSAVVGSQTVEVTSGTATIPLSSSSPACKVPASVDLAWNSRDGGMATFQVTCSKISGKAQTVTITGGNSSTSFTLKP